MARIPYVPLDLAEPADLVAAVRQRRGGELSELDRLLLHSPALTEGWNFYLGVVRTRLGISPKLRELSMCGVAVVNRAQYEFDGHLPLFLKHGGTPEQGRAMQDIETAMADERLFDRQERATLRMTYEMTRNVHVSDATFQEAAEAFGSHQGIVELVGVIATYNMVSRFLVALEQH